MTMVCIHIQVSNPFLEFTGKKTKSNSKKKFEQHFSYIITFLYCPHPKCPRPEGRVILATTK